MMVTPFRLFLFAVAAFLAAGGTAYYTGALDAYFAPAPRQVAEQEANGEAGSAMSDAGKQAAADEAKAETPGQATAGEDQTRKADAQQGGAADKNERVVVPAFDIVRVEPDGSMVVAGHAAPKSNVEVVSGSTIVGKAQTGAKGDFAVVLDKPLEPGNHQIVLRSTTPQDVVATSKETALVSVPETENGEVLALVEAPGKPSRLITKPAAQENGARHEVAEADKKPADISAPSRSAADEAGAPASDGKAEQPEPRVAMTEPRPQTTTDAGAADGKAPASTTEAGAKADDSAAGEPTQPAQAANSEASDAGSAEKDETPAAKDTAAATDKTEPAPGAKPATGDAAASAGATAQEKAPEAEKGDVKVFIEAVEIDGEDIFVAGGGVPGQRVRVYANDILLGTAVVSPNGRFLVQTTRELPVGDYIIRADLLSDNGADVIARAAVPFEREPGEKLAAVAPNSRVGDEGRQTAGGKEPAADASADSKTANKDSPDETTTTPQPASKVPDSRDTDASADAAEPQPANGADTDTAAPASTTAADVAPADTTKADSDTGERVAAPGAQGGIELPDLHNGIADSDPVITAPKLEPVDGAVIIRRGDTLWQISRRVYGRGVRYSTIYLANREQIRDPDMIWPGQVFSVPPETKDGATADMKAIGEQAVPADMAGTEPEWRRR